MGKSVNVKWQLAMNRLRDGKGPEGDFQVDREYWGQVKGSWFGDEGSWLKRWKKNKPGPELIEMGK